MKKHIPSVFPEQYAVYVEMKEYIDTHGLDETIDKDKWGMYFMYFAKELYFCNYVSHCYMSVSFFLHIQGWFSSSTCWHVFFSKVLHGLKRQCRTSGYGTILSSRMESLLLSFNVSLILTHFQWCCFVALVPADLPNSLNMKRKRLRQKSKYKKIGQSLRMLFPLRWRIASNIKICEADSEGNRKCLAREF